uniref:Tat-binding protein 10 n=1 Tax=Schistosoma japonicum TaxID=6182 RepID=C1L882_SCHJA|nr:Tat-binding protein 10 [Schistosoma japonicum]
MAALEVESYPRRSPKYLSGETSRKVKRETDKGMLEPTLPPTDGIKNYYMNKIDEHQFIYTEKVLNLRRLEAQRNELNAKVRMLREELQLLQEQARLSEKS